MTHSPDSSIPAKVRKLYEVFPYPRYPLLAKPRWQDGYTTSAAFSSRLMGAHPFSNPLPGAESQVLIGGAGEILPYVIRRWTGRGQSIICVDLSASSLKRARFRLGWRGMRMSFIRADIDEFLRDDTRLYHHVDLYGVLHHLKNPSGTLALLANRLAPGATLRLMVYNSPARSWIRQIQAVFALLHYDCYNPHDLADAKNLLKELAIYLPRLAIRLQQIGADTLRNDARFVDTFLHAREARLGIAHWLTALEQVGLKAHGLLDRYAELDDLPNPLWQMPTSAQLVSRAADLRFENNLELFVSKPTTAQTNSSNLQPLSKLSLFRTWIKGPPRSWFDYNETRCVRAQDRLSLWHNFLRHIFCSAEHGAEPGTDLECILAHHPPHTLQRLARIGALLPSMNVGPSLRQMLQATITDSMDPPELPRFEALPEAVLTIIEQRLQARALAGAKRTRVLCQRLTRI